MINNLSAGSPIPSRNLLAALSRFRFQQSPTVAFGFGFTLFCLILSVSTASAQTRLKRANAKPEERLRRVNEEGAGGNEAAASNKAKQAAQQPSLVRKTSMIYTPRTGKQEAARPTLTNDFVIVSEASEAQIARSLMAPKASTATSNIPSIWPVVGALRSGVGVRSNPFGGSSLEFHKGQDISAPTGTPVNATADGVVVIAGWVRGYGNGIYIDHGNGISTRYGHLSRIDVAVGQVIKRGEHLGLVGSTGRSTGPHLHYEVRINGQPVSPLPYLPTLATPPAAK
jgi:murein DD-endopeptidase MepM/ murein hydrolase activator NlpD